MLNLPKTTVFNKVIPKEKIFSRVVMSDLLQDVYDKQISEIVWRNKLSKETFPQYCDSKSDTELEVFEILAKSNSLDKRLLRQIDRKIPYYIFHLVSNEEKYQAWIANKITSSMSVKVVNYVRSSWLDLDNLDFDFSGKSVDETYHNLIEQVSAKRKIISASQAEECNAFMNYFRVMKMSRSYKPILILATIQSGGKISVEDAAQIFIRFYKNRINKGLVAETGNCIYADETASLKQIYYNLITNPVAALCNSGFFAYDSETTTFGFANDIYDGLTLEELDEISAICKNRLNKYFERIEK